jgi:dipeptidyl aminopeptidase/acylaminoacyl peptidase
MLLNRLFRRRRFWLITPLLIIALLLIAYLAASEVLYRQLATVLPHCGGKFSANTPARFTTDPFAPNFNPTPYFMPNYQAIEIPSRDANITLSSWFIPADSANVPAVIVIHGLGVSTADCKHNPRALLPAGILHQAGYNVLMIDLRQHGDSTITTGMWAANTTEYRDVLGSWDWLINTQKIAPQQIGLFAYSGGTGAALIAMGHEPQIAAAWIDSPYADLPTSISDHLSAMNLPAFLIPGGLLMAQLRGDNLLVYSPLSQTPYIGKSHRPVAIVHSVDDPVQPSRYSQILADALREYGGTVDLWLPPGTQHVGAMFDFPQDYAKRLGTFFDAHLRQ